MQDILINLGLIGAVIIVSEIIARLNLVRPSLLRKAMHVASGGAVVLGSYLTDYRAYIIVGVLMTAALFAQHYLLPLRSLQDRFNTSHGEVYFALGVAVAALLCPTLTGFLACVVTLALADTAAYVVGNSLASPKLHGSKSVAGSLACLLVTFVIFTSFSFGWGESLIIASYITAAELLSDHGADNMAIPVVGSLLLVFLQLA